MEQILTCEQIYQEYRGKVTSYVRSKVVNVVDVEDIVSKVFMKIVEKLDTFDSTKAALSTWIYTITGNTVIDFYRMNKAHSGIEEVEDSLGYVESGFDEILNNETLEELAIALENLDERSRDLIILHYYSGLTLKEIGLRMGMSYANVKIVHNKALKLLKGYMDAL